MSMQILRIEDPRDALEKARRPEIFAFAKANNVTEITPEMPAMLMRRILRTKGLTNIRIPNRVLGQPELRPQPSGQQSIRPVEQRVEHAIDALDDLMKQFEQQSGRKIEEPEKPKKQIKRLLKPRTAKWKELKVDEMDIYDLRQACLHNNIPMARRDRKPTLVEKLKAFGLE